MSKYRVKYGMHIVKGQLVREGQTVEVDSETFAEGERVRFFEKVVEKAPEKEPADEPPADEPPADGQNMPKKRGPKPKGQKPE